MIMKTPDAMSNERIVRRRLKADIPNRHTAVARIIYNIWLGMLIRPQV